MNHYKKVFLLYCLIIIPVLLQAISIQAKKYKPEWNSLRSHKVPQWMQQAKFGIYGHWGPYSLALGWPYDEGMELTRRAIYFYYMYLPERDERKLFERHIGPVNKGFGYKDLIRAFKAEKFDPVDWAETIAQSGAQYAGIAAVHHDGFGLWDSDLYPWCAGKSGPKRDVYGEFVKELRKRGLRTIASFHHLRTYAMWNDYTSGKNLVQAKKENWDILDPKYKDLYHYNQDYEKEFLPFWSSVIKEVIDKYRPDVIWCDGGNMREGLESRLSLDWISYYFNKAEEWGKEVSVHNKLKGNWGEAKYNFGPGFGVYTYENGRDRPDNVDRTWEDDTSIVGTGMTWPYHYGATYQTAAMIVTRLIHLTALGGGLLLSLTPNGEGVLEDGIKDTLKGTGKWLEQNGEAIFKTKPWKIKTEGDLEKFKMITKRKEKIIHIKRPDPTKFTWEDIRFTCNGNTLYVMCTGIPPENKLSIKSLSTKTKISSKNDIESVKLLGSGTVKWKRDDKGLHINLPGKKPNNIALAFKIKVKGTLDK